MSGCCPTRLPAAGSDASVGGRGDIVWCDAVVGIGIGSNIGIDVTAGKIACSFKSQVSFWPSRRGFDISSHRHPSNH